MTCASWKSRLASSRSTGKKWTCRHFKKKRAYCFERISLPLLKDKLEIWYWVFISRNLNMEHNKQLAIFRCVLFYRHVDPWPETHEGRSHWWAETSHSWLHRSCWRTRTPLKKTGFMHWLITVIQYNVLILFSIDHTRHNVQSHWDLLLQNLMCTSKRRQGHPLLS